MRGALIFFFFFVPTAYVSERNHKNKKYDKTKIDIMTNIFLPVINQYKLFQNHIHPHSHKYIIESLYIKLIY